MKKIDIGQMITIFANVGVIVGIIFLAVEVKQNNRQLELQSYQAWVALNIQINSALMDPEISAITYAGNSDSINLSEDTFVTHAMSHLALFQIAQSTDYLYRAGSLDRELWEAEMNRTAGILTQPGVRQWWDAGGRTQVTPRFAEFLESIQTDIAIWSWNPDEGYFRDDGLIRSRQIEQ
jgi:hypothetical protein